jgi:hypothetical protein
MHKAHTHNASTPFIGCLAHLVEKKLGGFHCEGKKMWLSIGLYLKKKGKKEKENPPQVWFWWQKRFFFCKKQFTW